MSKSTRDNLARGIEFHRAGNLRKAEVAYRQVLRKSPRDADANHLLGLVCLDTGRPALAVKFIAIASATTGNNPEIEFNLGMAHVANDDLEQALPRFRAVVDSQPANPDARNALGNTLRLLGQLDEAQTALEEANRLRPDHPGIRANLSLLLNARAVAARKDGDTGTAMEQFLAAIEFNPQNAEAQLNLGIALEESGDLGAAADCYRDAIKARPDFTAAHYRLAHSRHELPTQDHIEAMCRLLDDPKLEDTARIELCHGIGEASDRLGHFDDAWQAASTARQLRAASSDFDIRNDAELFVQIRDTFTDDLVTRAAASSEIASAPILVVGMPRSGTTLTEQILSSHSAVHGIGESPALPHAIAAVEKKAGTAFPACIGNSPDTVLEIADRYASEIEATDAVRRCDKSPMNFKYLGIVAAAMPEAHIVHCVRHPLDTCLSIYMHPLAAVHGYANTLESLGAYYLLYREIMAYWHALFPGRIHDLHYESLVADTESQVRHLLDFCGLDFESQCIAFHETERQVTTPSAGQVRQPMYSSSVGRWRNYEQPLQSLRSALEEGLGDSLD